MRNKNAIILGLSFGHGDSSAALIVNGKLCAAAEEERFNRIKHFAGFPKHAVKFCLEHANISPSDVETIAIARRPWNGFAKKAGLVLRHPSMWSLRRKVSNSPSWKSELQCLGIRHYRVVRIEHHLAHLWSARYLCPDSPLAMLSFDGLGDFVSAAIGKTTNEGIEILERVYFPHSVGFFYTAMTQFLGFPYFGDEFKVMGLSSYGKPKYIKAMRQLIREKSPFGFELNLEAFPILEGKPIFSLKNNQPVVHPFFNKNFLTHLFGVPARRQRDPLVENHFDLAKSVQLRFEEIAFHLLSHLHARVPEEKLALAGGCAHNSAWVGKITKSSPFREVYVAPASNDAGIAVGAAVGAAANASSNISAEHKSWALLGPHSNPATPPSSEEKLTIACHQRKFLQEALLLQWMVQELKLGKIIGLFRGRMEFGPRALGCRSILCDPSFSEMKDKLNARVKHREKFRPFAASVLWDCQHEWLENSFYAPTMEAVFTVKKEKQALIPAVVHVDQTCRIQSVTKQNQPFLYKLLSAFYKVTGVPMLLNTSFNDCEPIVCTQQDAIRCFSNTEMDHLILHDHTYSREIPLHEGEPTTLSA